MFWQKEPKNLKIIVLIIVMCVVFGTLFLIYSQKKPKKSELPSEIEVIETETGKIVRNRAEGYEVTIPKEWRIEKGATNIKQTLYSPEVPPEGLIRGCKIEQGVIKRKTTIKELKKEIEIEISEAFNPEEIEINKYEEININGYNALKHIFKTYLGHTITILIPLKERLLNFTMFTSEQDLEKCNQYFDEIIKTILIK